ncbi:hypothetical protein JTE90_027546 [Oedothorax gibbosus]|uniref:Fork-head domain-containing protein n=1 Tax=Oedothorax gibbosus TaxID=931172 RepID=A0AAV6VLZ5_9ARAC|nr:hypothetical protein JTE90_027546 [Oedothorax gibbosus]
MAVKLDEELRNDFKWLIDDFNLHAFGMFDIDGTEVDGHRKRSGTDNAWNKKEKRPILRKSGVKRRTFSVTKRYCEIIERCLSEKGELPARNIHKWIAENFPGLKLTDRTWKNKVSYSLTTNPIFKKKKLAFGSGSRNVWYMDKELFKPLKTEVQKSLYHKNFLYPKKENSKRNYGFQNKILTKPTPKKALIKKEELPSEDFIKFSGVSPTNLKQNVEMDSYSFGTQNLFHTSIYDSGSFNTMIEECRIEPEEYYELEVPIPKYLVEKNAYEDNMEVKYFFDESNAMTLEII